MVATAIYSVTVVLWKETAFPVCRAMERRWKRNVVSRVSFYYRRDRQALSTARYCRAAQLPTADTRRCPILRTRRYHSTLMLSVINCLWFQTLRMRLGLSRWWTHRAPASQYSGTCRGMTAAHLSPDTCSSEHTLTPTGRRRFHSFHFHFPFYLFAQITEQKDAHMINTKTTAGQERHRKLALIFCP